MTKLFVRLIVSAIACMTSIFIGSVPVMAQSPVVPISTDPDPITMTAVGCIGNGGRTSLSSGVFQLQIVDGSGNPAVLSTGDNLQVTTSTLTEPITSGSIASITIPNPANTTLSPYFLHLSVLDKITNKITNYPKVQVMLNDVAVAGRFTQFNFCKANTTLANGATPVTYVVGPQGPQGIQGATGATGATGGAGIGSDSNCHADGTGHFVCSDFTAKIAARNAKLPLVNPNLLNPAAITSGYYLYGPTNTLIANAADWTSDYIPVAPSSTVMANFGTGGSSAGYAFYDINQTFISGVNGSLGANAAISVPANAVYFRICSGFSFNANTMMVVNSATMPLFSMFATSPSTLQATAIANATQAIYGSLPSSRNLFDQTAITTGSCLTSLGAINTSAPYHVSAFIPVVPGLSYVFAKALGGVNTVFTSFYDSSGAWLAHGPDLSAAAGTTFTAPTGAATFRLCESNSVLGTQVLTVGTIAPTSYVPYDTVAATTAASNAALSNSALINGVSSALTSSRNLFNSATTISNGYINATGAQSSYFPGYYLSDYIPVIPGVSYTLAQALNGNPASGGSAYYDVNKAFLSMGPLFGSAAGTTFTPPANAVYYRLSDTTATLSTQMLSVGTSVPAYIAYGAYPTNGSVTEASVANTSGLKVAKDGDSITASYSGYWEPPILSRLGMTDTGYNNARGGRTAGQMQEFYGGYYPYPALNCSMTSFSIATNVLTLTGSCPSSLPAGTTFWVFGGTTAVGQVLQSLVCTISSGSTTSIVASCTYGAVAWIYADTGATSDTLTVVPKIANGTISNCGWVNSTGTVTVTGTFPFAFPSGTKVAFSGLTACSFLNPVTSPVTSTLCTVTSGATTSSLSATCLTNGAAPGQADITSTSDAGTLITPGHNVKCYYASSLHNQCNGGTAGNTWSQDFLTGSPDIYLVGIGTNDTGTGTPTSNPGDGTESGSIRAIVEMAQRAKPTVRVMFWLPYLQSSAAVGATIKAVLATYGIPAFDSRASTPLDNPVTWTTYLQTDHTHPNAAGGAVLGSFIASQIKAIY